MESYLANNTNGIGELLQGQIFGETDKWNSSAFSALRIIQKSSNQILQKNADGSLEGVRYAIASEPSTLRPIRSWTINIEKWECKKLAVINARDVLFIRIMNLPERLSRSHDYSDLIRSVVVNGKKINIDDEAGFNAIMASVLFISKIDSGRMPDINKIIDSYKLIAQ